MIGYLCGQIIEVGIADLIVLVNEVGYRVHVGKTQISNLKFQIGKKVELFIHTHVREDEISLYGFADKGSLKMFELLIGVSGVGPKMGMNVLAKGSAEAIQRAVAMADVGFFTAVSGIGKKNAQRIIVDLKGKLGSVQELEIEREEEIGDELVQALTGMGFEQNKVIRVLREIEIDLPESQRIKLAIKRLSGNR